MTYKRLSSSPLMLLLLVCCLLFANPSKAELSNYVKKYNGTAISQEDLLKLSEYDYLIDYFCSFSFFKPRHRVSPDFIKALFLAESRCDPHAVSSKKALGLGQIIHSTGKQVAREIYSTHREYRYVDRDRLQNLAKEDLFDPAINTLITCYLISKYNMRFDGKLDLVISAWNAGENIDSLKIGEPAPYSETLNLIGKVNSYYIYLLKLRKNS